MSLAWEPAAERTPSGHGATDFGAGERHAAPLALDCCAACRFFLPDSPSRGAAMLRTLDRRAQTDPAHPAGACRRNPQTLRKQGTEWCGEFTRRARP